MAWMCVRGQDKFPLSEIVCCIQLAQNSDHDSNQTFGIGNFPPSNPFFTYALNFVCVLGALIA